MPKYKRVGLHNVPTAAKVKPAKPTVKPVEAYAWDKPKKKQVTIWNWDKKKK